MREVEKAMEDYVHIFLDVPPKYSPAEVVQILKDLYMVTC
jgi:REP element-mobilizing transposase RayT